MSVTSKSPRKVALEALAVAEQTLPRYWHRFSPKVFTVGQLFACLVLKAFFKTDYRGIAALLADLPDLTQTLGLQRVPHFTTLHKNATRLLDFVPANQLLQTTVQRHLGKDAVVEVAAADSTGMETSQVSPYFVRRKARGQDRSNPLYQTTTYTQFPKIHAVCDCATHLVLSVMPCLGPTPDVDRFRPLLWLTLANVAVRTLLADAGYDSEPNHAFAREGCRVRSVMPASHGRPCKDPNKPLSGKYRDLMRRFRDFRFGQRWQIESVFSMIKRRLGPVVLGRSRRTRSAEMMLKVLTHNIMIRVAILLQVFYRARRNYFLKPSIGPCEPWRPGAGRSGVRRRWKRREAEQPQSARVRRPRTVPD
jgi:hypothetical protein